MYFSQWLLRVSRFSFHLFCSRWAREFHLLCPRRFHLSVRAPAPGGVGLIGGQSDRVRYPASGGGGRAGRPGQCRPADGGGPPAHAGLHTTATRADAGPEGLSDAADIDAGAAGQGGQSSPTSWLIVILLARGIFASVHLNHQKCVRADLLYARGELSPLTDACSI